jgi:hypothetical protein
METFAHLKPFASNPKYHEQRRTTLEKLDYDTIDAPIVDLVRGFAGLPYCFPLQSCYGHFLHGGQKEEHSTQRLPSSGVPGPVDYRIAYIALCIQNTAPGRTLFQELRTLAATDPKYVQFACAEWFWARQVNSYALQVEPEAHKTKDRALISYREALHVQEARDRVFNELRAIVRRRTR